MKMKMCAKCKMVKKLNQFYNNARSIDGHDWTCKFCSKERQRNIYKRKKEAVCANTTS